ncbi:hypothetical protein, partial [Lysinibacillus agricola]|uniref:hypothetical protein n=1 Tax=Lysinibacillus agricola TaxID=2590012 RepID=UPI003C1FFCA0
MQLSSGEKKLLEHSASLSTPKNMHMEGAAAKAMLCSLLLLLKLWLLNLRLSFQFQAAKHLLNC